MALIKCRECGKEMSEYAKACPNCGAPNNLTEAQKKEEVKRNEEEQLKNGLIAILIIIIVLVVGFIVVKTLWNGLHGNELMEAMGIETDGENLTIKSKDQNKIDKWKNDAMDWLGFEYVEE